MDTMSLLYYGAVALWSAFLAYTLLFTGHKAPKKPVPARVYEPVAPPSRAVPMPYADDPGSIVSTAQVLTPSRPLYDKLASEGFKTFQTSADLTVEDIVKGLSRN